MLVIAVLIAWNSVLLWMTVGSMVWWLLPYFGVTVSFYEIGMVSFLMTILLAAVAASPVGDGFLKFPLSIRRPIKREQKRLTPLLEKLNTMIREKQRYLIPCQLLITEVAHPYLQTIGRRTIILPRHLFDALSDEALLAGIAAAMGRFYERSSLYDSMRLGASFLGHGIHNVLQWLAMTITRIGYRHMWLLPLGFLGSLLSFLLKGVQVVSGFLVMAYLRRCIYAADQFSKSLGLKDSLIAYLDTLAQHENRQDGFFEKYQQRFPSATQRIGALEGSL